MARVHVGPSPSPSFHATSQRVEHLPCTPIILSGGGGLMLPLPGPKGVPGYKVG